MKRTYQFSWVLLLLSAFLLMLMNSTSVQAAPELTIGHYELVSSKRITRTVFEYTYKADITNTGSDALDVSATLSVTAPGVTVLDGQISFGDVAAGARVTSSDTFAIRQDRQYSFAVDAMQWTVKTTEPLAPPSNPQVIEFGEGSEDIAVNTLVYEGQINLPPRLLGLAFDELYVATGLSADSPVSADGRFKVRMNSESTGLIGIFDSRGDGYLLRLFPKVPELAEVNPIIDAKTTAIALIALQPGIVTADPYLDAAIVAILARLPEVDLLADQIYRELINGTFRFNRDLSGEVLNALSDVGYALANVTLDDLAATSMPNKLKSLLTKWLTALVTPAHAEVTFADPCQDLFTDHFYGTPGTLDGVCIGAELAGASQQSTFYMENRRSRWVFLTLDSTQFGGERFDLIDVIPPRHVDFPNVIELLWEGAQTTADVFVDMFSQQFNASEKLKVRMDKRFGPAKSKVNHIFTADGLYTLNTVGWARNKDSNTPLAMYGGSLALTMLTEVSIPLISIIADIGDFTRLVDKDSGERIVSCGLEDENIAWLSSTTASLARLLTGQPDLKDYIEWVAFEMVFNEGAYRYAYCVANPEIKTLVNIYLKVEKLQKFLGTPGQFVAKVMANLDKVSTALDAIANPLLTFKDLADNSLASMDEYVAVIGGVSPGTPITDIDFADSNLRQCVLDAATASGWQTVEQVTALSCAGRNITSLAGLESFINLQTLDIGDNQITDIAPLVNLTQIGQLDLTGNNGIRCMELDGLAATLSSTTITRPADCISATGTGKLNDTGITWCANDTTNNLPCPVASHPGQDGDHGRDALARAGQLQKVGGGAAGFDFTKLDANGNALPASATSWDCVRDNVTGLIWEVKTTSGLRDQYHTYTWYDPNSPDSNPGVANGGNCTGSACDTTGFVQAVNQQGLCGASDWRMPTRRELQGIVDYGRNNPAIDTGYFPNTPSSNFSKFWSSSPCYTLPEYTSFYVYFNVGGTNDYNPRSNFFHVRLVRGGQ